MLLALIPRALFAFTFSYLHPDEHLQGPQVVAHGLFGLAAQWPWELRSDHPIRSFLPLWLFYGIPMSLFPESARPEFMLYAIRILMAITTWVFGDMAIDRLSDHKGGPLTALLFSATSYVTWTYQSHTLSNSFETILVLWFLVIVHEFEHTRRDPIDKHTDCFFLGVLTVIGIFNRPTFLFWIAIPCLKLLQFFWQHPWSFGTFIVSFSAACSLCIYMDTLAYKSSDWVIAPLNNLIYNSQAENLALHGTHPWYTHLVSSVPQLLGPGILFIKPKWSLQMQAVVGGVALLSLVPHQETRFLTPIVLLLCTHMDFQQFPIKKRRFLVWLWLIFNIALGFLMGVMHQGGVLDADIWLGVNAEGQSIVWWKTYNPPLWLMNLPTEAVKFSDLSDGVDTAIATLNAGTNYTRVVDMMGAPPPDVAAVLASSPGPVYFVAPVASPHEQFTAGKPRVWHKFTHLGLDNIDFGDLKTLHPGLGVWLL